MLASSWPFDAHVVSKDVIEELQTLAVLNGDAVDDNLIMDRGVVSHCSTCVVLFGLLDFPFSFRKHVLTAFFGPNTNQINGKRGEQPMGTHISLVF